MNELARKQRLIKTTKIAMDGPVITEAIAMLEPILDHFMQETVAMREAVVLMGTPAPPYVLEVEANLRRDILSAWPPAYAGFGAVGIVPTPRDLSMWLSGFHLGQLELAKRAAEH